MKFSRHWLWLLMIPLIIAGLSRLHLSTDVLDLLPANDPAVEGIKLYQRHFSNARELIVTIKAPSSEKAEDAARSLAEKLARQTNLVASAAWQPPWLERGAEIGELLAFMRLNQPRQEFAALTNQLAPEHLDAVLAQASQALATSLSPQDILLRSVDPYGLVALPSSNALAGMSFDNPQGMFGSKDGLFRAVYVQPRTDFADYRACIDWITAVKAVVHQTRTAATNWDGVVVQYTGGPAFMAEIAGSMETDIRLSVIGTSLIIGLLFWVAHRRWLPMIWLLVLLALILVATLAFGGLLLGTVSIISMGFAAILLGLAVDYALVHYQEALAHPAASVRQIRRAIAPSILWAAVTTICAFLALNLGGLPGLAELGSLVAIGVALSALVMVVAYLPPLFRDRIESVPAPVQATFISSSQPRPNGRLLLLTIVIAVAAATTVSFHPPAMDRSANALRPIHSSANAALVELQSALEMPNDPLWIIISGKDETAVSAQLRAAQSVLDQALQRNLISKYLLPSMLWPDPRAQAANRNAAQLLASRMPLLQQKAIEAGFAPESMKLTEQMLQTFARLGSASGVLWPTNSTSQWIMRQFVARSQNGFLILGLAYPPKSQADARAMHQFFSQASDQNLRISSWQMLGYTTLQRVQNNLWQMVLPMALLVLASLWAAFRRLREVLLGIGVLLLSGVCLLALMSIAGWSWNLFNLMALPVMLGTGVDYSIFMQLALRRHHGDLAIARRSVGRALLLCGATAVAGFGSIAWFNNAGLASFGRVCAIGIAANMLIAVFLLPAWWNKLNR